MDARQRQILKRFAKRKLHRAARVDQPSMRPTKAPQQAQALKAEAQNLLARLAARRQHKAQMTSRNSRHHGGQNSNDSSLLRGICAMEANENERKAMHSGYLWRTPDAKPATRFIKHPDHYGNERKDVGGVDALTSRFFLDYDAEWQDSGAIQIFHSKED